MAENTEEHAFDDGPGSPFVTTIVAIAQAADEMIAALNVRNKARQQPDVPRPLQIIDPDTGFAVQFMSGEIPGFDNEALVSYAEAQLHDRILHVTSLAESLSDMLLAQRGVASAEAIAEQVGIATSELP
jgi:hypothetical protein